MSICEVIMDTTNAIIFREETGKGVLRCCVALQKVAKICSGNQYREELGFYLSQAKNVRRELEELDRYKYRKEIAYLTIYINSWS